MCFEKTVSNTPSFTKNSFFYHIFNFQAIRFNKLFKIFHFISPSLPDSIRIFLFICNKYRNNKMITKKQFPDFRTPKIV